MSRVSPIFRWPRWKLRLLVYGGVVAGLAGLLWFMCGCNLPRTIGGKGIGMAPELVRRLERHVRALAGGIGERSVFRPAALDKAADYIETRWREVGFSPAIQTYKAQGVDCRNLECTVTGTTPAASMIVVGAHYDAVDGSPGADDNATGVAALLELSFRFRESPAARPIRFVAFANEEPPFFTTDLMGSRVYAAMARRRGDAIHAMLSLESIGYYSDVPGSQAYPPGLSLLYPDRGNFVAVVGSVWDRSLVHRFHSYFAPNTEVPSECLAAFHCLPGVSWSDHASFWEQGYPALMITDTAPYRNPHYHRDTDLPDTLDWRRFASVTLGVEAALRALAREP